MIKLSIRDIILAAVVILLLYGNLGKLFNWDNDGTRVKTESSRNEVVQIDTVERIIEKIIVKQPIVTNMTREVSIPYIPPLDSIGLNRDQDSIKIDLPINRYEDTLDVDGAELIYNHEIAGFLQSSKYKIKYPKETVTVTDSVFTTKTQIKNRIFDVFLVGGYQYKPNPSYTVGGDFVTKKWKVGLNVGFEEILDPVSNQKISQTVVNGSIGIRLFGY